MKLPKIKYYEVETEVENWDEISIKHKDITFKFIKKQLAYDLMSLDFIRTITLEDKAYPLRLGVRDIDGKLRPDICLFYHKKKHKITIIRDGREGYAEMENKIVDAIYNSLT